MKTYYCRHLYNEINFDIENIQICSGMEIGASHDLYDEKKYKSFDNYLKDLFKWRKNLLEQASWGKIPHECQNCLELEKIDISYFDNLKNTLFNKFTIKKIYVKTYRQCELSCVYCLERRITNGKQTLEIKKSDFYDFIPIFKALIDKRLIDKKNTSIEFHGGSISVWDEFEDVLQMAYDYGIKDFTYLTNAYRFIPKIAQIAQNTKSKIIVSLDSGCKETFKKIKQSDKFDEIVNNIIEYFKANVEIVLKYIILNNINDNLEEIQKFCNVALFIRKANINGKYSIQIDLDYRDILPADNGYIIPEKHREIIKYILDWGNNNNIQVGMQTHVRKKYENIQEK